MKTKNEMNLAGSNIPTAWLLLVPFVNIWWIWKYAVGVEEFTEGGMGRAGAFLLVWLLGCIGAAVVQASFNTAINGAPARGAVPAVA